MPKISIDRKSCKGCGKCTEACPTENVIEMFEGVVIINDQSSCSKCMICEKVCPKDSIKISQV